MKILSDIRAYLNGRTRTELMLLGVLVVFGFVSTRLFYLQVIRHDHYVQQANNIQISKLTVMPERGKIFIRDGDSIVPLVLNQNVYTVYADPSEVKSAQREAIIATIREVAGGNAAENLSSMLDNTKSRYVVLAKQVSREQAELIKKKEYVGVGFQETSRRVYPEKTLAAQLLGYVDADGKGQYGLEGALNTRLTGRPGMLQAVTDVRKVPLTIGQNDIRQPAVDGDELVLTIDRSIQSQAETILSNGLKRVGATKGSVLVMDPRNGAVLAMANMPTYNPGEYNKVENYEVFQNGVVSQPYETGSVIKTLTMGVGLDSGAIAYDDTFNNTGSIRVDDFTITNVEEDPIDPAATMTDILHYSLNTGVVHVLQEIGGGSVNKQARDTLYHYFHNQFRLGELTGIEQAGEAAGTVIGPDEGTGRNVRYANMTFGQGMDVTMIQTAAAFSALINGGTYYKPHLVAGVREGSSFKESAPEVVKSGVVKPEASEQSKRMIWQGRKQGFFGHLDAEGYMIGGKTGTSQVIDPKTGKYSDTNSIGTYLGFGATNTPSYVIMVKVEDSKVRGGYEGTTAAGPIFNDLNAWMIDYLRLSPGQ